LKGEVKNVDTGKPFSVPIETKGEGRMKPVVSLIKGEEGKRSLREALEHHGGMEAIVPRGATVMIKPNFTGALPPETGAASDPRIAQELARLALRAGTSKVIIAEGIGGGHVSLKDVEGLREISEMKGVEVVDLNDEQTEVVAVSDPLFVEEFEIPRVVLDCDFLINFAKLKVHPQAVFTLGMKNLMGALPGRSFRNPEEARRRGYLTPIIPGGGKKIFHDLARDHGVEAMQDAIVDLNTVIPSHLTVIDGIYGMEGKGSPVRGTPLKMDLLILGTDLVAVEAVGAAVMGFDPESIPYVKHAVEKGLGFEYRIKDLNIQGAKLDEVRRTFEPASAASLWDEQFEQ
jgi:uncharacterized protein (DUF362 family)